MGESGVVLRIERSSIHDGEGLRTVVFLKGCPLSCVWCSTPESQSPFIENGSDKTYGKKMLAAHVVSEVEKDSIFFLHSGGGVTISGGEPLMQPEFTESILKGCKSNGINTAMETCLHTEPATLKKVVPYLDTLYADLKFIDNEKHKKYCGHNNDQILSNMRRLSTEQTIKMIIRIPLIPGINDSEEDLTLAADFCNSIEHIHSIELLPYHRLGVPTYSKLGLDYTLTDIEPPESHYVDSKKEFLRNHIDHIQLF